MKNALFSNFEKQKFVLYKFILKLGFEQLPQPIHLKEKNLRHL